MKSLSQNKTCQKCGKVYNNRESRKYSYCSQKCYHLDYYDRGLKTRHCAFCDKEFSSRNSLKKFCSNSCLQKAYRRKLGDVLKKYHNNYFTKTHPRHDYIKKCKFCGTEFHTNRKVDRLYCSSYCNTKHYRETPGGKLVRLMDFHKRNSEKKNVESSLTREQWKQAKEYFLNCCAYCQQPNKKLHQDHFIPLKLEGAYTQYNIVPACPSCNQRKNSKHPREWLLKNFENGESIYKEISKYLIRL